MVKATGRLKGFLEERLFTGDKDLSALRGRI
jgi:hypothetical protein